MAVKAPSPNAGPPGNSPVSFFEKRNLDSLSGMYNSGTKCTSRAKFCSQECRCISTNSNGLVDTIIERQN